MLIADYWIVRKTRLRLEDLYLPDGTYRYSAGWNWRAVAATLLGCAFAWGGLVIPALKPLSDYGWFVGFGVAFVVYVVLMRGTARADDAEPNAGDRPTGRRDSGSGGNLLVRKSAESDAAASRPRPRMPRRIGE